MNISKDEVQKLYEYAVNILRSNEVTNHARENAVAPFKVKSIYDMLTPTQKLELYVLTTETEHKI